MLRVYQVVGLILLCNFITSCSPQENRNNEKQKGYISFFWQDDQVKHLQKLILMDGNGSHLRYLGYFGGSQSFSKDGKFIATGCDPEKHNGIRKLCILDLQMDAQFWEEIPLNVYSPNLYVKEQIEIPELCKIDKENKVNGYFSILSIDWSPKGDAVILSCGEKELDREVCVLSLTDNSAYCWDHSISENVYRVVWSPTDQNVLITSGDNYRSSDIKVVDSHGKTIRTLGKGMHPEWSPDGKKVAYIENFQSSETNRSSQGLSVIDLDGANHQTVFSPNMEDNSNYVNLFGSESGVPARLAWSPNGNQVVFSGTYRDWFAYGLFSLDLSTGKVTYLLDPMVYTGEISEPDWSDLAVTEGRE